MRGVSGEKWDVKATSKINSSPTHTKNALFRELPYCYKQKVLLRSAKGLGIIAHKDVYRFSFLKQGLLNIKKQIPLVV